LSTGNLKHLLQVVLRQVYKALMTIDLKDPRNWDTPLFPISVAAVASTTEAGTMRMWFQRDRIKLHSLDASFMPDKPGVPRLLTLRTVLSLAAAAPLVRKGVDVESAYKAAQKWTYIGEGWDGQGDSPRDPGELFKEPAWTMLIHYGGEEARVVAVKPTDGLKFNYSDLFARGYPVPVAPTILFLNKIDQYARGVCEGYLRDEQ
jgi:hypothetical protein